MMTQEQTKLNFNRGETGNSPLREAAHLRELDVLLARFDVVEERRLVHRDVAAPQVLLAQVFRVGGAGSGTEKDLEQRRANVQGKEFSDEEQA